MKLRKVEIENFRSIKTAEIDFEKYPCRILWGVNESGKSNIIKALMTLDPKYDIQQHSAQDKRMPSDEETDFSHQYWVDFCFALDDAELLGVYNKLKTLFLSKNIETEKIIKTAKKQFTLNELVVASKNIVKRVDLNSENNERPVLYYTGDFTVTPKPENETYELLDGWYQIPVNVTSIKIEPNKIIQKGNYKFIKFDDYAENYTEAEIAQMKAKPLTISELRKLVRTEIENMANAKVPNIISWDALKDQTFHSDIPMQTFLQNPSAEAYSHFKSMCLLASNYFPHNNDAEIVKVFEDAKKANRLESLYSHIEAESTRYLQSIWKGFENEELVINTSRGNDLIGISVKHVGRFANKIPTSYRSDGFKKFLKLMLTLSLKVKYCDIKDTIILIDEAETFLHPSAAENFRDELIKLSQINNNRIVFSTHSPFMIDDNNIERHIIVEKDGETTSIKDGQEGRYFKEEELWQKMGCPILRAFAPKNLLFEGWDDKMLYSVGLNKITKAERDILKPGPTAKLGVAYSDGAQKMRIYAPTFQWADSKLIILADSDDAGKEEQKHFVDNRLWCNDTFFTFADLGGLDNATAEDYLVQDKIDEAVTKLKAEFHIEDAPDFTVNDMRVMQQVKTWLKKKFASEEKLKPVLKKFKDFLFDGLTEADIKDEYKTVLSELAKKIKAIKK